MPGFIKNINGSNRMRFTRPGTDPNNLNLDPNLVVFDSETIGNLSVLFYGENLVPQSGSTNDTNYTPLRSWSLPYAPMVIAQIKRQSEPDNYWSNHFQPRINRCYLESTPTGLTFVRATTVGGGTLMVRWTAFRYPI